MTDSDTRTEEWTAIPGYFAEVTDDGQMRSVDRVLQGGRAVTGRVLATRVSNRGYVLVNVYDHDGVRQTRTVHTLMLLAFEGPLPRGMQARHWNDISDDNRWAPGGEANCGPGKPGNVIYGTRKQNDADRLRNNPEGIPRPSEPPARTGRRRLPREGSPGFLPHSGYRRHMRHS